MEFDARTMSEFSPRKYSVKESPAAVSLASPFASIPVLLPQLLSLAVRAREGEVFESETGATILSFASILNMKVAANEKISA